MLLVGVGKIFFLRKTPIVNDRRCKCGVTGNVFFSPCKPRLMEVEANFSSMPRIWD